MKIYVVMFPDGREETVNSMAQTLEDFTMSAFGKTVDEMEKTSHVVQEQAPPDGGPQY